MEKRQTMTDGSAVEKVKVWLTSVFDDVMLGGRIIIELYDEIVSSTYQFNCLVDCNLFSNGIQSIKNSAETIKDNIDSFNRDINDHNEKIVDIETHLKTFFQNLEKFGINLDSINKIASLIIGNGTAISTLGLSGIASKSEEIPDTQEFVSVNNGQSTTGVNKENIEFITQKYKEQAAQESHQLAQTEEQKNQLHEDFRGESNDQSLGTELQQSTPNQNLNSGLGSNSSQHSDSSSNNDYTNDSYVDKNKPTFSYPSSPEFNNGFIKDENQNIENDNVAGDVPTIDKDENNVDDNLWTDDSFTENSTPVIDNSINSNINNNIGNAVPNENIIGNNSNFDNKETLVVSIPEIENDIEKQEMPKFWEKSIYSDQNT